MQKINIFFVILLLAGFVKCDLKEFVSQKMSSYSNWLYTNGFDPSPVSVGPDRLTYNDDNLTLDWDITNHQVRGHSMAIGLWSINGNLTSTPKYFTARWSLLVGLEFYGNYSAKGSVGFPKQPISAYGQWSIWTPLADQTINYIYFDVTPSGYLNVTSVNIQGIYLTGFNSEIYFENLLLHESAAGWENHILSAMFSSLKNYLNRDPTKPKHPLRSLYVDYWKEILSKTTLQDIIDATDEKTQRSGEH